MYSGVNELALGVDFSGIVMNELLPIFKTGYWGKLPTAVSNENFISL